MAKDKPAKEPRASEPAKGGRAGKNAGGASGDGLLTGWTVAYGVIFGGLWWMGWLAVQRAPGEDVMHVAAPYGLTAGALFLILMFNISEALARGAQQGR